MTMLLIAALLAAQGDPDRCIAVDYAVPKEFAYWGRAAGTPAVGRTAEIRSMPVANVRLAVQPSRPLTGTHVATAGFDIAQTGRYRVAAGGTVLRKLRPLWIDVAGPDGKPLSSVGHGHAPGCNGITKVVEFDLKPGRYTFLASGMTSAQAVRLLIVRKP